MLARRPQYLCLNADPIADCGDFAKRHASLRHSERTRIHSEKHNAFATASVSAQVRFVSGPCVIERIINVCHWIGETELRNCFAQADGGFNEWKLRHGVEINAFAGCWARHSADAFDEVFGSKLQSHVRRQSFVARRAQVFRALLPFRSTQA